jgi:hypothetical protein
MSTSFLDRSRLERKVLDLVNDRLYFYAELSGLSVPTLKKWRGKLSHENLEPNTLDIEKVNRLLLEISQRISSNSDSSKHIFAGEIFTSNGTIDVCIDELKKTLSV